MSSLSDDLVASMRATVAHQTRVRELLHLVLDDLLRRLIHHDDTKLNEPEAEVFARYTPLLRASTYNSPEYHGFLREMRVALDHHYAAHRHHPEHFPDGIAGMNLLDLLEMLVDWRAATERHENGNLATSIEENQKRFGYSSEMKGLLRRTAACLGLL